ncbi:MAG: carboxypeptidase-like regulatory domain-containing protein, partial [Gemmatimonadetes bacterium]|nr:carboxypeptidase-like regulatory domain-containing protein [Gemmatimonadota bacterium]
MRWTSVSVLSSLALVLAQASGEAQLRESMFAVQRGERSPGAELVARAARAQALNGTITGVVVDASSRRPVAGASVVVVGTALRAVTSGDGRFTISNVPDGTRTVRVTMVGYGAGEQTVTVSTGQSATLNFDITPQAVVLGEIVAVGYGTQQKAHLTAAVDQVGAEVLQNRPMSNLTQGLQGVLPNVNIRLLDGKPIQSPRINVRGTTSIGQGGSALVLIDGVEGDPSMLNPNDVEAISVLKDASAAAVYGARGAFGVVLITTKGPERNGFNINYETSYGVRQLTVPTNIVTDGYTWARMFNESFFNWEGTFPQNVNKTLVFSQQYLAELERRSKDSSLPKVEVGPDGRYVYYESTDWFGHLYDKAPPSMEHSLSVSRSAENASFMISGRYLGQDGLFRYSSDDFRMLNLRATGQVQLFPWLQVTNNLNVANRNYYNPLNVGEGGGIWRNIGDEGHPLSPLLNPDGTLALDREEFPRPGTTADSLAGLPASFGAIADRRLSEDRPTFRELINQKYPDLEIEHVHHAGNSSGVVDGAA